MAGSQHEALEATSDAGVVGWHDGVGSLTRVPFAAPIVGVTSAFTRG